MAIAPSNNMKKIISFRTILLFSLALIVVGAGIIAIHYTFFRSAFAQNRQPSFFSDYASWGSGSIKIKDSPMWRILTALNTSRTVWIDNVDAGSQFVDLNGDGLLDFLYAQYVWDVCDGCNDQTTSPREMRFAAFINKGNFSFEPIYKCYGAKGSENQTTFYGDCAQ